MDQEKRDHEGNLNASSAQTTPQKDAYRKSITGHSLARALPLVEGPRSPLVSAVRAMVLERLQDTPSAANLDV